MDIFTNIWLWAIVFVLSGGYILYMRKKSQETVQAQFLVTGLLLIIFYVVCFFSGVCTILSFIKNWFF